MRASESSQPGSAGVPAPAAKPEPANAAAAHPAWMLTLAAFLEVVPFVGKPLAKLLREGVWQPFVLVLALLWTFLIYPLVVPLLASWYLNLGLLSSWHQPYAESVRRAFKVEELAGDVALRGNRRLDYFHFIEFSRSANAPHTIPFGAQRDQRMIIRPLSTMLRSTNPTGCPVPLAIAKQGVPIFDVRVGNVQVGTLRYGPNQPPIKFEASVWAKLRDEGIDDRLFVRLDPAPDLAALHCPELLADVQFTVEVYKDLVGEVAASGMNSKP